MVDICFLWISAGPLSQGWGLGVGSGEWVCRVSCVACRAVCRVSCVVCRVWCLVCRVCVVCRVSFVVCVCGVWRVACGVWCSVERGGQTQSPSNSQRRPTRNPRETHRQHPTNTYIPFHTKPTQNPHKTHTKPTKPLEHPHETQTRPTETHKPTKKLTQPHPFLHRNSLRGAGLGDPGRIRDALWPVLTAEMYP